MAVEAAFAVPHPPLAVAGVGRGKEAAIASTLDAFKEVARRVKALDPDVVILSSPHATSYYDYVHISPGAGADGDFAAFGDSDDEVRVTYDPELARALELEAALAGISAGTQGERSRELDHGSMVPLTFLQAEGVGCPVVRMGLAGYAPLEHYRLGEAVNRACERLGRRAVFVASGDLSHKLTADGPYGFAPEAAPFDRLVCHALATGDFGELLGADPALVEGAAQCGLKSFLIMAGTLDGRSVDAELLSYEGPFGVGYAVASFTPTGPSAERHFGDAFEMRARDAMARVRAAEDPWVRVARESLECWVRDGRAAELPADLPPELAHGRAGAFCSIKKDGELRGCIGTTEPTRPTLAQEIAANAVSAGTRDPRFPAVVPEELPWLVYSVDVLRPPEPAASETDLNPARYGVIVSTPDGRRGLLLPDLPGVDTVEDQLAIARKKGGIGPAEPVALERFEVVRHR